MISLGKTNISERPKFAPFLDLAGLPDRAVLDREKEHLSGVTP